MKICARIRRKLKSRHGFTLAEVLMAVLILLMVSSVVAGGVPVAANAYYKVVTNRNEVSTGNQWYGTVSGDSRGITTTTGTTTTNSAKADANATGQVQTQQTTVPTQQVTATPMPTTKATPTPTPAATSEQNQAYNPTRDITAPSTDSGNLSQPTGKK